MGNLQYRLTACNFNPLCAKAGRITVAEVEELVDVGMLTPHDIDTAIPSVPVCKNALKPWRSGGGAARPVVVYIECEGAGTADPKRR